MRLAVTKHSTVKETILTEELKLILTAAA